MSKRKEIHVVPNRDSEGWDIKRNNASRASFHYDIKSSAMEKARLMSKVYGAELIPHGRDGKIQNPDSHGRDPLPPRDRR